MNLSFLPSIDIIIGPMHCGKTSEIIRRLSIYYEMDMKVLYINSKLDTRSDKGFSTHNSTIGNVPFDCLKVMELSECDVSKYDVIAIDESQFFKGLKDTVLRWVEVDKKILIVGGLNGDYKRNAFGEINELISYSDSIIKLNSFCMMCRKKGVMSSALFSKRIIEDKTNILIGGKDIYLPTCRYYTA